MAGKRVYRSSQGKAVDLGALLLQNETVRAVGNMGVNARGDKINIKNKVIETKAKQSQRAYAKQIGPQDDIPQSFAPPVTNVVSTKPSSPDPFELQERNEKENNQYKAQRKAEKKEAKAKKSSVKATVPIPATPPTPPPPPPIVEEPTPEPVKEPEPTVNKPKTGGLAEAIAKAKTIKQEQLKTPRQQAQEKSGVRRI
tara:strand:+ start:893 stop:1486 length:594 start_codon:yes stop_codon:yes gene_type:complete